MKETIPVSTNGTTAKSAVTAYQKKCFQDYKASIGYPEHYTYLSGSPINPLVPIETALGKAMIVGAYPSAKFFTVSGVPDTPMADNDAPFSDESYFDGSRVRTIPSGKELNEVILERIGLNRNDCWVTDLVKVFLFKPGHIDRYHKLGRADLVENRSQFRQYAERSLPWLEKEIGLANPKLTILLGMEVCQVVLGMSETMAKDNLTGELLEVTLFGRNQHVICLPHPGILMKKTSVNPWPERFDREIAPRASRVIQELMP